MSKTNDTYVDDINVDSNDDENDIRISDSDDFYGQTREIIIFAEKGIFH